MNSKFLDSSEKLLGVIPREVLPNLEFRKSLHGWLAEDKGAQDVFLKLLFDNPEIAYDSCFFIYEAREATRGLAITPFILYPSERILVQALKDCIDKGQDLGVNKSREEGATETIIKFLTLYTLLVPNCSFLVGSQKEEYVDKSGTTKTLFAKIDQAIKYLPLWMKQRFEIERSHCKFKCKTTESLIDGEATNENFGAGGRATAVLLDEFGRVDAPIAESIAGSVWDVSNTIIFNSTHWFGSGHSFAKMLKKPGMKIVTMPWFSHPLKSKGLYKSPKIDEIEIVDKKYYLDNCPDFCKSIDINSSFKIENWGSNYPHFVADGCERIPGDMRSPWHDKREERSNTYREFCSNVWMSPTGASDMFFDSVINVRIRTEFVKRFKYEGELEFTTNKKKIDSVIFKQNCGRRGLKVWGDLIQDKTTLRPNQLHNYIVGADIGFGTGASNSTAEIVDVNTGENVGEYVCSDKSPEEFADLVAALCKWVGGGTGEAYLIFENNGGQGANFSKRVIEKGLTRVYTQRTELNKSRRTLNKYGWHSGRSEKEFVLSILQAALKESLKTKKENPFVIIHNEEVVNELDNYVFYESGEVDSSEIQDLGSGARKRHGDRVIGLALCVLAMKDQKKLKEILSDQIPYNSIAWRRKNRELREKELNDATEGWQEPRRILRGW